MYLFIDCEWNDWQGGLISIALVSEDGRDFYRELPCAEPSQWVAENVIPKLGGGPTTMPELQAALEAFLSQFDAVHVVADWPEDIQWFCRCLIKSAGKRIKTPPMTMEVRRDISGCSTANPHNALADAYALRDEWRNA